MDCRYATDSVLGIDLGGTKIAAGVVAPDGAVLGVDLTPTPPGSAAVVVDRVLDLARRVLQASPHEVQSVGIGTAGQVDPRSGCIVAATRQLPADWPGTELRRRLEDGLGRSVRVLNDTHAMALGEATHGAARGAHSALCLTVGTGVGGALVHEGSVYTGWAGAAGLLGHVVVRQGGRVCACGRRGHLEAYAAGPAILRSYRRRGGRAAASAKAVFAAAAAGQPAAIAAIDEAAAYLGAGIGSLVNAFNPEIVVLGGGLSEAGPRFVDRVWEVVREHTLPAASAGLSLVRGQLGIRAAIVGAAVAARRHSQEKGNTWTPALIASR